MYWRIEMKNRICHICSNDEVDIFYKSKDAEFKILGCDMCVVEVDTEEEDQARKEAGMEIKEEAE